MPVLLATLETTVRLKWIIVWMSLALTMASVSMMLPRSRATVQLTGRGVYVMCVCWTDVQSVWFVKTQHLSVSPVNTATL